MLHGLVTVFLLSVDRSADSMVPFGKVLFGYFVLYIGKNQAFTFHLKNSYLRSGHGIHLNNVFLNLIVFDFLLQLRAFQCKPFVADTSLRFK